MNGVLGSQSLLIRLPLEQRGQFYLSGFWRDTTIYDHAKSAAPTKIAIRTTSCTLTYGALVDLADSLAEDLAACGLVAGDRVAAWISGRAEIAVLLLACSRNGYVLCPSLHSNHTVEEITGLLGQMRAAAFVGEEGYGADGNTKDIFKAAQQLGHLKKVIRLPPPQARTYRDIFEMMGITSQAARANVGKSDDVVYLAFTSGTTAEPKGVMHSNNTLLANARAIASDWQFSADSVIYTMSPPSHNLGFGALVLTMLVGAEVVFHDLSREQSVLDRLVETQATFIFGVPAHAIDLLSELEARPTVRLNRLKGFRISGAAVSTSVVVRLMARGIKPQSGYGMTEACSHHYTLPDDATDLIVNTSGRACPGYEIRIFSPEDPDEEVPDGQVGHVGGRGASLMLGYFDNQAATESSFNKSGWFMTGDLGQLDSKGYLKITGRIKDIIIRGGHNIHPAKIEQLAMRHPSVARAAAVAVKDERLGEKVCIVVMPKNGANVDPGGLLAHLHSEGLSKYDMPEYFLEVSEIPLSASGKILKRALEPSLLSGALVPQAVRWQG